jgi:beta-1,2-mannobiose phosphorylase / 1,2-beta-oligomannan phosphorylase
MTISKPNFKRWKNNPILQDINSLSWCKKGIRNPGAVLDNEKIRMLFTANATTTEPMQLGYAESTDGFNFNFRSEPVLSPSNSDSFFDRTGIDDPRITFLDGWNYISYASPAPINNYIADEEKNEKPQWLLSYRQVGLARTKDWENYERLGPITNNIIADANVVLFPEKIDNKYVMIHRPTPFVPWLGTGFHYPASMFIAFSDDILDWGWNQNWTELASKYRDVTFEHMGDDHLLIRPEYDWERIKIGASGVPIPTDEGWLVIYHGGSADYKYRVGLMLLDRENPKKVLARSSVPIFEPETIYETAGAFPYCVFPCSNVVIGDEIFMYYGACDERCAVVTIKLKELLDYALSCR